MSVSVLATSRPAGRPAPVEAERVGGGETEIGSARRHLAHAPEWAAVIQRAYGHTPLYLTGADAGGRPGLLPAFIVRRPFAGTIVTSMPFLDGGGPCTESPEVARMLVAELVEHARKAGADVVEIRSSYRLPIDATPLEHKVNMVLPLRDDADTLWRELDRGVRNQVRKAERAGLAVEIGGAEQVAAFYAVFAGRMRELGSPVHGRAFFQAMFEAFGAQARVAIVRKGPEVVGGLIALAADDAMVVPWASSATAHRALCPNMILYWAVIREACRAGFRRFDFGRSTRGSGTYGFKRQWGALEQPLFWYTIPLGREKRSRPSHDHGHAHATRLAGLWRRLPLTWTTRFGPFVRKYLVQ